MHVKGNNRPSEEGRNFGLMDFDFKNNTTANNKKEIMMIVVRPATRKP